jgi:hypothetical protein
MRRGYVVPMRWMVIYEYEVPAGVLNLSSTKLLRPWSPWEPSPSSKIPKLEPEIETRTSRSVVRSSDQYTTAETCRSQYIEERNGINHCIFFVIYATGLCVTSYVKHSLFDSNYPLTIYTERLFIFSENIKRITIFALTVTPPEVPWGNILYVGVGCLDRNDSMPCSFCKTGKCGTKGDSKTDAQRIAGSLSRNT